MAERGWRPTWCTRRSDPPSTRPSWRCGRMDRSWIPVRHWRLNERHYGDLQGLDKKATAERWCRPGQGVAPGLRRPPPAMPRDDPATCAATPRYAALPPSCVPDTECLADVVDRMLPYWYDGIVPLVPGGAVLVAAHGNGLQALVKHLSGLTDGEVVELNIPTGEPLVYEMAPGAGRRTTPRSRSATSARRRRSGPRRGRGRQAG